jgi:hypothetical protein
MGHSGVREDLMVHGVHRVPTWVPSFRKEACVGLHKHVAQKGRGAPLRKDLREVVEQGLLAASLRE